MCHNYAVPIEVRLVNGRNASEGRVELSYDGTWGTVCGDHLWSVSDATVVCRMLGYSRALEAPVSAFFGQGCGEILLANVHCSGMEDSLIDCTHLGLRTHYSCDHRSDAGIICSPERLAGNDT